MHDRDEVEIRPGVELQSGSGKVRHRMGIRGIHNGRSGKFTADDREGNPSDSTRIGSDERPAIAQRAYQRSELADDKENGSEDKGESEKHRGDE